MNTPLHHKAFLLLLALVTVAFVWLLLPFYGAVLWAVILAIIFQPMQRAFEKWFWPRRNLAALISTLVCVVIAVIPMTLIVASLVGEGARFYERFQSGQIDISTIVAELRADLPTGFEDWMREVGVGDYDALRERLTGALMQGSQLVAGQAVSVTQNTLHVIVSAGIMLYLLFFLFRDGREIGRSILAAMPLSPEYNRALVQKFATVVRATVKGNVIIAIIQGIIGGLTFWSIGIEGAFFWGVLMAFLSMLPAVGAAIVWAPAALYFFITGDLFRGLVLVGVGVGVIGLVDNLLRPPLVGKDTRLPDYVVLVSTVGGMSLIGINGFVIGPLIAALFIAAWTLFRDDRGGEAEAPNLESRPLEPDPRE
ncbi:AI-2E family transporter [Amaricoccus sp.]|uniref:AI-2E family transporter n=1 Tax=Amaricoccus sp. TaxID=1872485 RepID=UPI002632CB8C|nr:AI-2E family transporter [uncultured Amaricoccus sp.]